MLNQVNGKRNESVTYIFPLEDPYWRDKLRNRIREQKESVAVEAPLTLPNLTTGNNTKGDDPVTVNGNNNNLLPIQEHSTSVSADEPINSPAYSVPSQADSSDSSTNDSSGSTRDSENIPLSELRNEEDDDNLPLAELKIKEEENIPLSELKRRLTKDKPFFKMKWYELYKYKRKRVFKCIKCEHAEKSQKQINTHFWNNHGYLVCNKCDKQCNTISALRKHPYEHTVKASANPCKDCGKTFTFSKSIKIAL